MPRKIRGENQCPTELNPSWIFIQPFCKQIFGLFNNFIPITMLLRWPQKNTFIYHNDS